MGSLPETYNDPGFSYMQEACDNQYNVSFSKTN